MKKSSLILLVSALALTGATAASAQTAPTPPTFGSAVPGQCVLDEQTAMGTSNMGKAASDRLGQLKSNVDAELQPEATALETEYKSLQVEQKSATTPAAKQAFDQKAAAWSDKRDQFQQKAQLRQQEMQQTQQQVLAAIFQKMIPSINAVVTQKQCATVLSADSLLHYEAPGATTGAEPTSFVYANPASNITADVVAKMNATGETLPAFDRAHLDQRGPAPTAAAPAARAKPAAAKPAAAKPAGQ
jgi:Skp family chaperone for outer membrane proteins